MRVHIVAFLILSALLAPSTRAHADGRPGVEQDTKAFLEALDKSGGTPIEKLSPAEARAALGKLQAGNRGVMPGVEITERRIQAVSACITALYQVFGRSKRMVVHHARQAIPADDWQAHDVEVVAVHLVQPA